MDFGVLPAANCLRKIATAIKVRLSESVMCRVTDFIDPACRRQSLQRTMNYPLPQPLPLPIRARYPSILSLGTATERW